MTCIIIEINSIMNQYPGFVPMMVPQPYMVAMPTAIPMSGAVPPTLQALPHAQVLHPQVAHMAGAPMVTSAVMTAAGRAAQFQQAMGQLQQGLNQLPQGMGGQLAPGMGQYPAGMGGQLSQGGQLPLGVSQTLGMGGLPGMPHSQGSAAQGIPTAKVVPQIPVGLRSPDSGKRPFGDLDKGEKSGRFGNRWQSNPEQEVEEPNIEDSHCVLDHFNSDLNLVLDRDCLGATVVLDPPGFCFTWSGARATYGICKGKAFYEVHILEYLPTDFGEDHQEMDPNVVRLGWSIDSSSFQLGEEPWSFGYGGTGKFSTNNRFSDYGQRFEAGDVIGAMLDLDSRPGTISFLKNGAWLGVALPLHGFPVGSKDMALYPHVLTKNCRFKVNFGQQDPWFPPPAGFPYIGQLPLADRVRGMKGPERKADCEMIMIVGLPGVGKTTWAINLQKSHPEKRYNIIGTDTLIDKMRVNGLPRKRNYHGRWEVLIDKATKCLNKLFQIASKRKRNYILDQTNVYASARRRKMKSFYGFYRIAAVIQPEDPEMQRRSTKRTVEDGKIVPETAVLEMKANFALPEEHDGLFDRIDYIELPREKTIKLVEQYVREGIEKRPPREEVFKHDNRFQDQQNQQYRPQQNQPAGGQQRGPAGPGQQSKPGMGQGQRSMDSQWYGQGDGLLGRAPDTSEPAIKRIKLEPGMEGRQNQQGGALDLLKQQYDEVEPQESQWGQNSQVLGLKQEGRWPQDASAYTGAGLALQGTPLMSHLTSAGALVVAPPGGIPLAASALGAQPPPPPPPVMQSQLAHSAAGTAFVAITSLPPPGPPPTMLAVGGLGILGVPPPGFPQVMQPQQQQQQLGSSGRQGGGGDFDNQGDRWQPSPSGTANSTSSQFSQQGTGTPQGDWNQSQDSDRRQNNWRGDYSSQQQQQWQEQERDRDVSKGWRGSESRGNSWQQNKEDADRGQGRYESGGKFGGQVDKGGAGGYDTQTRNYGGSGTKDPPNRRFDDFSRPPPGRDDSKTDDYQATDSRDRGFDGRNQSVGADRWAASRQRDSSSTQERWNSRQDNRSERPDRSGQQDSRESRWSGSGGTGRQDTRAEPRASDDRWSSAGRQEERSRPNIASRQEDRGRTDDRGPIDRWGSRGQDNSSVRDRDRDKDRSRERDRGRETDMDRDSYNRGMDRTEREADTNEPRQRRRKSKWDNPDEEGESRVNQDSNYQPQIKQEPGSPTRDYQTAPQGSTYQQGSRQQYFNRPGQSQPDAGLGGNSSFPPKGMSFNKPPPSVGSGPGGPPQGEFTKDRNSELPSLMDMPFGNRSQSQSNQGGHPSPANQSGRPPTSSNQEGRSQLPSNQSIRQPPPDKSGRPPAQQFSQGARDQSGADGKGGSGETSLLGPVPSGPPTKFPQAMGRGSRADDSMPNISVPPPRDGPPPGFGSGASGPGGPIGPGGPGGVGAPGGPGVNRPPFPPGGPRFSNPPPEAGRMGGPGQRPSIRLERPPGPMGPRNPQGFSGPPPGNMGGPPPNSSWNQPRFAGPGGGGRGTPRFEGPGGPGGPPGGGRFPGGPGPMRWPRGPR